MMNESVDLPPSMRVSKVNVVGLDIPFTSMVFFMVKWTLASLPALVIIVGLFAVLGFVFGGAFEALRAFL